MPWFFYNLKTGLKTQLQSSRRLNVGRKVDITRQPIPFQAGFELVTNAFVHYGPTSFHPDLAITCNLSHRSFLLQIVLLKFPQDKLTHNIVFYLDCPFFNRDCHFTYTRSGHPLVDLHRGRCCRDCRCFDYACVGIATISTFTTLVQAEVSIDSFISSFSFRGETQQNGL